MSSELIVKTITDASNYLYDAKGKDTIPFNFDDDTYRNATRSIVNNELVISTTTGKTIRIKNWENLSTYKTSDDATGLIRLTGAGPYTNITNPINDNLYQGTGMSDRIDARNQTEQTCVTRYKNKKKKWVTETIHTGIGAEIDAGAGNDVIFGSNYNDVIYGGEDTSTSYESITGGKNAKPG